MTDHHVDAIALRVRAGVPPPAGSAEAFVREMLARAGDIVHARFHGGEVYVRRVAFARRLSPAALADPGAVHALAAELSQDLAALATVASARDVPSGDVLVFAGEAERRAAHIVRRHHGAAVAWWEDDLAGQDDVAVLVKGPPVQEVLTALAQSDQLVDVLAFATPAFLDRVEQALERPVGWVDAPVEEGQSIVAALTETVARMPPSTPPRALRLALALQAGGRLSAGPSPARWLALADRALADANVHAPVPHPQPSAEARPLEASSLVVAQTGYAGLFFLLNLVLELEAGEILYKSCLDERALLARALATLVPDEADAAPVLASGASPSAPVPPVTSEQAAEVAGAILDALLSVLPRRGLAAVPDLRLDLDGVGGDRLLIARPPGGTCAAFAWPAPTAQAVADGLRVFLSRWPRSAGRMAAAPALVEFEPERLIAAPRTAGAPPFTAAPAGDQGSRALVTQLSGALTLLALARIDPSAPAVPGTLSAYIAIPGSIVDDGELRTIRVPAEAVSFPLRRCGLDRDPGWVPWLERVVRFEFPGVEEVRIREE